MAHGGLPAVARLDDAMPAPRYALGVLLPLLLAGAGCQRSASTDDSGEPIAQRALLLLPPVASGRALFAGEDPRVAAPRAELDLHAARALSEEVRRAGDRGDLLARSRWLTAQGDHDGALEVVEQLGRTLEAPPDLAVERAAIFLERGRKHGRVLDAAAALDALAAAPQGAAARYDRSLALCALNLTAQARREVGLLQTAIGGEATLPASLRKCLAAPAPAIAASEPLDLPAALAELAAGNSEPLREALERQEIPRLLRAEPDGAQALAAAAALARVTGDDLPAALLAGLAPGQPARNETAAAAREWAEAERLSGELRPEEALAASRRAARAIGQRSPAWQARIELTSVASLFHLQRYAAAIAGARGLRARADAETWHELAARACWLEGLSQLQIGRPALALPLFIEGARRFEIGRQPGLAATLRTLEADARGALGELEGSLALRVAALPELARLRLPHRRTMALESATLPLLHMGYPVAALAFVDEAIAATEGPPNPLVAAEQGWRRAVALLAAGRRAEALPVAEAALEKSRAIASEALRRRTRAGIEAARGEALVDLDPARAVASLSAAIEQDQAAGLQWFLPDLLLARARAHRARGETASAGDDLRRAFAAAEHWIAEVPADFDRALYLETRRRILDEAVDFALRDTGDPTAALAWALRVRRDSTWGEEAGGERDPAIGGGAPARCAAGNATSLAVFALPDRLIRWACAGESLVADAVPIPRVEIERRIAGLRQQILGRRAPSQLAEESEALFQGILAPVAQRLRDGAMVRVVLDGPLSGVPLAALRDPATGRWAAELGPLLLAETWGGSTAAGEPLPTGSAGLLVVANPRLRDEMAAIYPPLAAAEHVEARRIVELFPAARVLAGERATEGAIEAALPSVRALHLAAHGVAHATDPGRAALLVAPTGDDEEWTAVEISRRRRDHLQLVVLSACESGRGFETSTVGSLSLARAFQNAGAGFVVGTLWAIDDEMGARFMARFYAALAAGEPPAAALLRAQREHVHSSDPHEREPVSWAGYFITAGIEPATKGRRGS